MRHAQRTAVDQPWSATTSVDELATVSGVDLGDGDQRLVGFGTTDNQLYETRRVGGVPQPPGLLAELVGYRANQNYPCMTYSSNETEPNGDLWIATRP